MRKWIACLMAMLLLMGTWALAEDYAALTDEELAAMLSQSRDESTELLSEMGRRIREKETTPDDTSLGKIKDVFPDEVVACYIRDELNKLSIEQPVTQAELDTITVFGVPDDYGDAIYDLTGIGYLRNVTRVSFYTNNGWCAKYMGETLPDEFYTLTKLEYLNLSWINPIKLTKLSDALGNFTELTYLGLENTQLTELPETIGNLRKLKTLNISNTKISALPDSIWTLELEEIDMAGSGVK